MAPDLFFLQTSTACEDLTKDSRVAELINVESRSWKEISIAEIFNNQVAETIFSIPFRKWELKIERSRGLLKMRNNKLKVLTISSCQEKGQ